MNLEKPQCFRRYGGPVCIKRPSKICARGIYGKSVLGGEIAGLEEEEPAENGLLLAPGRRGDYAAERSASSCHGIGPNAILHLACVAKVKNQNSSPRHEKTFDKKRGDLTIVHLAI